MRPKYGSVYTLGRELYSILLGNDSPFGKPYGANPIELNETLAGDRVDISNAVKAMDQYIH